jgi:protein-S-isoprenylcysteine O-methyltransferase Ste14
MPMLKLGKWTLTGRPAALTIAAGAGAVGGAAFSFAMKKTGWIANFRMEFSWRDWPMLASVGVWLLFSLYWEAAAKNAAPAVNSESRWSRRLHVLLANVALLVIFIPVPGLRQRFLPAWLVVSLAGVGIQVLGLALAIWARRHLGRNWSGEIAIKEDHRLVRSGPYGLVRHPIYTALLAIYAGAAVVSGEMHALVGLAMAGFAYWRKVRLEEANLLQAFGAEYREYCEETRALVPGGLLRIHIGEDRLAGGVDPGGGSLGWSRQFNRREPVAK